MEAVPEEVGDITVLGGLSLPAETHRATLTGEGGSEAVLRQTLLSLTVLERLLREWSDVLSLLRLRAGIVGRRLQQALRGNQSYKTMAADPLPGSLFGPRLFVWRNHQLARGLLLLVDGDILLTDGSMVSDVARRLELAREGTRLDGWQ